MRVYPSFYPPKIINNSPISLTPDFILFYFIFANQTHKKVTSSNKSNIYPNHHFKSNSYTQKKIASSNHHQTTSSYSFFRSCQPTKQTTFISLSHEQFFLNPHMNSDYETQMKMDPINDLIKFTCKFLFVVFDRSMMGLVYLKVCFVFFYVFICCF